MNIKRKLILMAICTGIIIILLTVNVIRKLQEDNKEQGETTVMENVMTRAEAYRFLSYLEYNKTGREELSIGITYTDDKMSGDYDTYVNAVCKMGLIDGNITVSPKEALTYGACKELIDRLILKNPDYQKAYAELSFDFTKAEENMQIADFLELYQKLLEVIPEELRLVKEETLLVLGREVTEDGTDRMVTDQGKYFYLDAKNYMEYVQQIKSNKEADAGISVTPANTPNMDKATANLNANLIEQFLDKGVRAYLSDQELICINSISEDQITIHNVWIKEGKELQVDAYINGIDKEFKAISKLSTPIGKVVGDITVENQKIVKIKVKPDMIHGKVLRSGKDYIEIEGYGEVPLDTDYKIYKIYGELSMEPTGSILVGYKNTDFIVSEGKISAALITEAIKAENIRVLIETSGFKGIYHDKIEFTASSDFSVSTKTTEHTYKKGEIVTITPEEELFKDGRITIKTSSEGAKIKLLSLERSYGNPKYRGSFEIAKEDQGLLLINELPLEEYLYAVIPSEMPTIYGVEALKVQAVCARSYAFRHLMANSLSEFGAHVNDSVAYQVYNNIAENEDSILAVKDTYGKVIEYENNVITAYYFSTSCGHTTDPSSVWANDVKLPYLDGKLMLAEAEGEDVEAQSNAADQYEDLSSEERFKSFIEANDITTYDSSFNWYRWKVTIGVDDIKKVIENKLKDRYMANPELILTMTNKAAEDKEAVFESLPINTIGDIVDISIEKRESSGILSEIIIQGTENTIKVKKEYNIRALLAPTYDKVVRQDESKVENLAMLPSAFFRMDKNEKNGKLSSIKLIGGGYGHGVGMSQNAVKSLVDSGKDYEAIVAYFYKGTELGTIYE